jgi:hypothetical protein
VPAPIGSPHKLLPAGPSPGCAPVAPPTTSSPAPCAAPSPAPRAASPPAPRAAPSPAPRAPASPPTPPRCRRPLGGVLPPYKYTPPYAIQFIRLSSNTSLPLIFSPSHILSQLIPSAKYLDMTHICISDNLNFLKDMPCFAHMC